MKLRGIEFGSAWCSSGSLGFFGDGYWYHRIMRPFGLDYDGATFVSKTTTLFPRTGNMPLMEDGVTPRDMIPDCVRVNPWRGAVLNAVGLSGPGAFDLVESGRWQSRTSPFLISFMSVAKTTEERMMELRGFMSFLKPRIGDFQSPFAVEMNFSCPNVGLHSAGLASEVMEALETASYLGVPLVPNFGPDASVETILDAMRNPACDAVSVSNTLRWGAMSDAVDWIGIWGSGTSPLGHLGGGGMSGTPIFPVVLDLVKRASASGLSKPLIAGGGVMDVSSAEALVVAGASAVKLGVVGMLRPWRVRKIVRKVRKLLP